MGVSRRRLAAATCAALLAGIPVGAVRAATIPYEDSFEVAEDSVLVVNAPGLLANDVSDEGTLCVTGIIEAGLEGVSEVGEDGSFTYTPPRNFNGTTSFGYTVASVDPAATGTRDYCPDPTAGDATLVTITVTPVNDAPSAAGDTFSALEGRTLNVAAPGVLGNDSDPVEGDPLSAVQVSDPTHGTLTLAANGGFSYTPDPGFVGKDVFSYKASDGSATSPTRVVTINVAAVPTPVPTAPPTPTPAPTPTPEVTAEPTPTSTVEPSAPAALTAAPSAAPSPSPSPTTDPAKGSGGLSLPVLVVGLLLLSLLAFGGAIFIPRLLTRERAGDPMGDDELGDDLEDSDSPDDR